MPSLLRKQKVHYFLHLVESMENYGPTSAFSAERYIHKLIHVCISLCVRGLCMVVNCCVSALCISVFVCVCMLYNRLVVCLCVCVCVCMYVCVYVCVCVFCVVFVYVWCKYIVQEIGFGYACIYS